MRPSRDLAGLLEIMAALRDPQTGCPWDVEQDFKTISAYTIEEAYEVADAIERADYDDLRDELGDLLLQPVFHAQMAKEAGLFDMGDVIESITTKLIRRHPHVFGDEDAEAAAWVKHRWEEIKAEERADKATRQAERADAPDAAPPSVLDDVPAVLPALMRAQKLDKRAARIGFDWPDSGAVLDKCREEISEIETALASGDPAAVQEEIGDLLFAVASLARHAGIESEAALRDANAKFTRRFHHIEARCRQDGIAIEKAGMDRLDAYWKEVRTADAQAAEDRGDKKAR